ncbi:MAG: ABATE domain-containing protein [Geothrix sp.]|nr:ABATE domain-containing protein [Geothrix sp.]
MPGQGPFELSGGDLCLDFANTWGDRGRPESDDLRTYPRLLAFARQTGLLEAAQANGLAARSLAEPAAAQAALQAALDLREALYGIFSARAHDREIPPGDLACLNEALGEALPNLHLGLEGTALAWHWRRDGTALTAPLWPIARAAADLLTAKAAAPVRECGGAQCTWLFLDHSRGRSRRWCSMASCGNRAKARRHYHRSRQGD